MLIIEYQYDLNIINLGKATLKNGRNKVIL